MVAYTYYEADNRVRRYAEALAQRGDEVDVFALKRQGQQKVDELNGVRIHRLQTRVVNENGPLTYLVKLLLFMFRTAISLTRISMNGRYDVIHVHSVPDFEVFSALIPRLLGSKVILDIHDIVPEFYASKFHKGKNSMVFKMLVLIEKLSTRFSNHVIIANHIWYDTLISRSVTKDRCTVILNYPDLAIFRKQPRTRHDGKFVMAYPGSLNWHQGVDVAIKAFARISEKYPQAEFHIYGDGKELDALLKLIKELNLGEKVFYKGLVPLEEIAQIMANTDLGIVPKRADSFGNEAFSTKIPEFMAMGIPVLASSTRIDRYYFNDSQIMFFKSDDVDDLASKMEILINDMDLRKNLVEHSGAYIAENNWNVKRNEYFDLIGSL
jgi:glycosyltransferase involved in cell wall biosynthesis